MITGCAQDEAEAGTSHVVADEEENDRNVTDAQDEDDGEKDGDDVATQSVPEPAVKEPEEEAMPRSDAYEKFLAGEMDVEVIWEEGTDGYYIPDAGTYSYDDLITAIMEDNVGTYDVKYAMFTPDSASEGEDILALYMENHDPSFYNWIGFIAYSDGKLQMRYTDTFGYRSFLEPYYDGYVLFGGSGGAGAHYVNCNMVMSDSSAYPVYRSAVLDSMWCDEASYYLDPDMSYDERPHINPDSQLHMTVVDNGGMFIKISVSGWSSNTSVKADEKAFVAELEKLGAKIVDESETVFENEVHIVEDHAITWIDIETRAE